MGYTATEQVVVYLGFRSLTGHRSRACASRNGRPVYVLPWAAAMATMPAWCGTCAGGEMDPAEMARESRNDGNGDRKE